MRTSLVPWLLALASSAQADLLLVPDQYPSVKAALNSAASGDAILVTSPQPGPGFIIDGISVDIYGEGSTLTGQIEVRNLEASDTVVLAGFTQVTMGLDPGLRLQNSAGEIHVQDCLFRGATGTFNSSAVSIAGATATFKNCQLIGGAGSTLQTVHVGGRALAIKEGEVTLTDCAIIGGPGKNGTNSPCHLGGDGGDGGVAIYKNGAGRVLTVGCTVMGGTFAQGFPGCEAGVQGLAFHNQSPSVTIRSLGDVVFGGSVGVTTLQGEPRLLNMESLALPGSTTAALVIGQPGDSVLLLSSHRSDARFLFPIGNTLELGQPLSIVGQATLGASGLATVDIALPNLPPTLSHLTLGFQALAFPAGSPTRALSNGRWVLVR